ncbi:hypothetical protein TWF506_004990 [Arthrobotrys conoides]|uniref:Uncharacterized protein n=1 Tax=Arthrobotrys conoides TaxID=74498 RepID=A0AAN8RPK8_9PEZI
MVPTFDDLARSPPTWSQLIGESPHLLSETCCGGEYYKIDERWSKLEFIETVSGARKSKL